MNAPLLRFDGELRPCQEEMVEIARRQISQGNRRLHFNAPPGSGKTVLGLYLWSIVHEGTALILSPNSAIATQWMEQMRHFSRTDGEPVSSLLSDSASDPRLMTSVTYQSLAAISRDPRLKESQATQADFSLEDPAVVISRLSDNVIDRMIALREFGIGMLILDECHHLCGHWGSVIEKLVEQLSNPIVVGLTGTPPDPDAFDAESLARYDRLLGPIDHEVPIPTIVKSGFLAPFQDLVWLVRPTDCEARYLAESNRVHPDDIKKRTPASTVMAHSSAKLPAMVSILQNESQCLQDDLRAVVITDFAKHAVTESKIDSMLDPEAGGAVAALRAVLADESTNRLDPILVTGSTVFIDRDSANTIHSAASRWIDERGLRIRIELDEPFPPKQGDLPLQQDEFVELRGTGPQWGPRTYVLMITELFRRGDTKCLVGTRGLLGEGWNAPCVNVLIDLTSAATSTSVRQVRGRAIRLDPERSHKVANHWDVVCIADQNSDFILEDQPDYRRLIRKHDAWFGVCDDGAIEKGVRHLHPDLDHLGWGIGSASQVETINQGMAERAVLRDRVRDHWKIGEKFEGIPRMTVDILWHSSPTQGRQFHSEPLGDQDDRVLELVGIADSVYAALVEIGKAEPNGQLRVSRRQSDHYRIYLEGVSDSTRKLCCDSLIELLSPLKSPRYAIQRRVAKIVPRRWTQWMTHGVKKWFARTESRLVSWHTVPSVIATRRSNVNMFHQCWNEHVGSGDIVYLPKDERQPFTERALQDGLASQAKASIREIFT